MRLLWSEVERLPLAQLGERLRVAAKKVGSVTLADLVAPRASASNGLYVFFDLKAPVYVGRAGSRAIIERVPSHLDSRSNAWFGTLLKYLANESGTSREAQMKKALGLRVAVLFQDVGARDLGAAETALRHALAPRLNCPRRLMKQQGTLRSVSRSR